MPLTLIRRKHGTTEDEPWIRADDWTHLAMLLGMPLPTYLRDTKRVVVHYPDGRRVYYAPDQVPELPQLVKMWAAHGYRWAVVSGTAPHAAPVTVSTTNNDEARHGQSAHP